MRHESWLSVIYNGGIVYPGIEASAQYKRQISRLRVNHKDLIFNLASKPSIELTQMIEVIINH